MPGPGDQLAKASAEKVPLKKYIMQRLMIVLLKLVMISVLILAVLAGIFFGMKDRFDIVACLLIGFNVVAFSFSHILEQEKWHWFKSPRPPAVFDEKYFPIPGPATVMDEAGKLMSSYDSGYIAGMHSYLTTLLNEAKENNYPMADYKEMMEVTIERVNKMRTVQQEGRFFLIGKPDGYIVQFYKHGQFS